MKSKLFPARIPCYQAVFREVWILYKFGFVRNVHNLLSYGVVGKSVCRMWESCTLAFPCAVNRVIHDSIASYAHFHNACLLVFWSLVSLVRNSVVLAVYLLYRT